MSRKVLQSVRAELAMIWSRSFPRLRSLAVSVQAALLPSREVFAELPPASRYLMAGLRMSIAMIGFTTIAAILALKVSVIPSTSLDAGASAVLAGEARRKRAYEDVTARPVFARMREASISVADAPAGAMPEAAKSAVAALDPNIVLKGVLISGSLEKAFITSTQNPAGRWIQINGEVDGWRLVEVRPEQATLEGQGQTLALKRSVVGK